MYWKVSNLSNQKVKIPKIKLGVVEQISHELEITNEERRDTANHHSKFSCCCNFSTTEGKSTKAGNLQLDRIVDEMIMEQLCKGTFRGESSIENMYQNKTGESETKDSVDLDRLVDDAINNVHSLCIVHNNILIYLMIFNVSNNLYLLATASCDVLYKIIYKRLRYNNF